MLADCPELTIHRIECGFVNRNEILVLALKCLESLREFGGQHSELLYLHIGHVGEATHLTEHEQHGFLIGHVFLQVLRFEEDRVNVTKQCLIEQLILPES
ncbi:hypothetical protein D3C86_1824570 [compost metagenome]